ncbi:CocE/NonD family hydrolase [Nocardioides jensenii]|uniref:CocE/NonD family hydrolase n=1 Tax=Nocardioides jensenii TaxID=1843 RepID=UPI000832EEDE|nr:CocE/NonD family hydrolase [Nocardioides jensenii]
MDRTKNSQRSLVALVVALLLGATMLAPSTAAAGPRARALAGGSASAGAAADEQPEKYDVVVERDVPITMRDGRVLRADIHRPAIKGTTERAQGTFPVILVQTPYGKGVGNSGLGAMNPYLVKRGYIGVIVDVAGTGGSEGQSMLFGRSEALDGAELVRWSAALEGSNGKVGLLGGSYLGIDQVFTAAAVGKNSPLKAIFPIATASDPYRDLFVAGGIVNMTSSLGLIAGYFGLRTLTPFAERASDPLDALRLSLEHGLAGIPFELTTGLNALLENGRVHDSPYWQERAPQNVLSQVVANGVPAYVVGGQYDVFQRGEPLLYSGLQNAWAGRSVYAPMNRTQRVTSRYQLLTGPWDHGNQGSTVDLDAIELAWFDHWLKGLDNGITDTTKPFHVQEPDGSSYDVARYPSEAATYRRLNLQDGKSLGTRAPTAATGSDRMLYKPVSLACQRAIVQWTAGLARDLYAQCSTVKELTAPQPGDLAYDTSPLARATRIAGPVGVTLRVRANRPQTMFVVTLQDVAPDGTVTDLSSGALLGSARAITPGRSWASIGDAYGLPYHPHTKAAERSVPVGAVTRYDIEVRPVFSTVPAGHRLRLLIQSGDTPHLLTSPGRLLNALGGLYDVQHNAVAASFVDLPIASGALPAGK